MEQELPVQRSIQDSQDSKFRRSVVSCLLTTKVIDGAL